MTKDDIIYNNEFMYSDCPVCGGEKTLEITNRTDNIPYFGDILETAVSCRNCGYQKHFGNEKICPVCIALKEQYHKREEKSSNKYYYFPFKEKYEGSYSMQTSFRKTKYNFNDIKIGKILNNNNNFYLKYININKDNKNSFNKSFYLNSIFASPINKIRKKIMKNKSKNKSKKKNRSLIINKYDVIKKYFA